MSKNMEHVMHLNKVMKNVTTFFLYLVPVSIVLIWTNFGVAREFGFLHRLPDQMENLSRLSFVGGFIVSSLIGALVVAAIYHLRKFFALGSEGKTFTQESWLSLHKFSKYLILYAVLSIPAETLLSVVMTLNNPVGERMIQLSLQPYDVTIIFLSFVFFAVSWVVKESVSIAEENAQFV